MRPALIVAAAAALVACGGGGGGSGTSKHTYHASAPVGDFLTLTIDHDAHTIEYVNLTNGDGGTVPYTSRSDGGMDVTDPEGDLVLCYELPGQAVVCQGERLGADPTHAAREPALVYGVLDTPLSVDDLRGLEVGFLSFRTREGGIEVGHISFDAGASAAGRAYFPINHALGAGCSYGKALYDDVVFASGDLSDNASYGCVDRTEGTDVSHIFGTAGADFVADSPSGTVFAFRDAASAEFDPTTAGTYTALVYQKGVSYTPGLETGTPTIATASVSITPAGAISVTQGGVPVIEDQTLLPFQGSTWQVTGAIAPSPGLFHFASPEGDPVFVTFFDRAMAFSTFHANHVGNCTDDPARYSYTYGIAVKVP